MVTALAQLAVEGHDVLGNANPSHACQVSHSARVSLQSRCMRRYRHHKLASAYIPQQLMSSASVESGWQWWSTFALHAVLSKQNSCTDICPKLKPDLGCVQYLCTAFPPQLQLGGCIATVSPVCSLWGQI